MPRLKLALPSEMVVLSRLMVESPMEVVVTPREMDVLPIAMVVLPLANDERPTATAVFPSVMLVFPMDGWRPAGWWRWRVEDKRRKHKATIPSPTGAKRKKKHTARKNQLRLAEFLCVSRFTEEEAHGLACRGLVSCLLLGYDPVCAGLGCHCSTLKVWGGGD